MIIIDLNQILLSNMFQQNAMHGDVNEDMLRHMALNSIRSYRKKFKADYGEIVIACDDKYYWRKGVFPYYKANRKKSRDESTLDWNVIFASLNKIRDELKEYFPYRVIQVDGAEADDVIAALVFEHGWNIGQRILIISGDKDFIQLHNHPAVDQYAPIQKKWIRHNDPEAYIREHILKGDSGDGVPNVLSPDDCLVLGTRQKTMSEPRLKALLAGDYSGEVLQKVMTQELIERNVARNKQLIDMNEIPQNIRDEIVNSYNEQANKPKKDLFTYFVKFKLKNLTEAIGDFV